MALRAYLVGSRPSKKWARKVADKLISEGVTTMYSVREDAFAKQVRRLVRGRIKRVTTSSTVKDQRYADPKEVVACRFLWRCDFVVAVWDGQPSWASWAAEAALRMRLPIKYVEIP